jgi:ectoine hydroxylase-related dioxygenase (phytanoyl-CoA dioxygenase family)
LNDEQLRNGQNNDENYLPIENEWILYVCSMNEPLLQAPVLSAQQLLQFQEQGYCIIENAVPPALLQNLHVFFEAQMFAGNADNEVVATERNGVRYVTNIDNLCHKGNLSCLELLGSPVVMEAARIICNDKFFPVQDFAVIKMRGDDTPVLWHQDMMYERSGPCCTMGVYVDDAPPGEGCLRVVPGSHLSGLDICTLQQQPWVEVPMKAGDILIHDMMLAHSSAPLNGHLLRRVVYFEFLATELVRNEAIYAEELVERRTALQAAAHTYYHLQHPDAVVNEWQPAQAYGINTLAQVRQQLQRIYSRPINARPSAYCFEQHSFSKAVV